MDDSNPFVSLELWLNALYALVYLPLLIGFFRFRKMNAVQVRIWIVVVFTFLSDSITHFLRINEQGNLWVYHFFLPLLTVAVILVYKKVIIVLKQWVLNALIASVVGFSVINSLFLQNLTVFNSNAIVASGLVFIGLSIFLFIQLINNTHLHSPWRMPEIWFNSGVLLHYSGILILFVFVNRLENLSTEVMLLSWYLNLGFTALLLMFYSISLWIRPQRQ